MADQRTLSSRLRRSYSDNIGSAEDGLTQSTERMDTLAELPSPAQRRESLLRGDTFFEPKPIGGSHLRRASSTSALPREDSADWRSHVRYHDSIVEAALIDEVFEFSYAGKEMRLLAARMIAVTTLSRGIKKHHSLQNDDSEEEDTQYPLGADRVDSTASESPSDTSVWSKTNSGISWVAHKVWGPRKKLSGPSESGSSPQLPDSKQFPKIEKKSRPARLLGYGTEKATPEYDSPASALYKTKKELRQEYDMARSLEFSKTFSSQRRDSTGTTTDECVSRAAEEDDGDMTEKKEPLCFVIHYAQPSSSDFAQWKRKEYRFVCQSEDECAKWIQAIRDVIEKQPQRPHKLMVFVNPHGGKRKAAQICAAKVYPLFKLANINLQIVETERALHCKEVCETADLSTFDGIVVVGGDGLFNEALNGLLKTKWSHLRVGLIPAGSTNTIVVSISGCEDATTSALHIILGDRQSLDVAGVFVNNKLERFAVSMLSYGFYGDVMKDSENFRWMGPIRYDYAGFKKYVGKQHYTARVTYKKPLSDGVDPSVCEYGCYVCPPDPQQVSHMNFKEEEKRITELNMADGSWNSIEHKFVCVNAAVMSCRCAKAPAGMAPFAHLSDGCLDLICVKSCSRPEYLQHLLRLTDPSKDHFDFDFVEVHKVNEFRLECRDTVSCWNIDGELLMTPNIHVKVYQNLVSIFARRPERTTQRPKVKSKRSTASENADFIQVGPELSLMGNKLKQMEEQLQVVHQRCEDLERENGGLVDKVDTLELRIAKLEDWLQRRGSK